MLTELPLFPLNTVLFPGGTLPLHIFEERYKIMINRCLERREPFGITLIRSGTETAGPAESFAVGTTANIRRIQRLPDGRLNIIVNGGQRFRIVERLFHRPYPAAQVELLEEKDDPDAADLADTVASLFAEYTRIYLAISDQWARSLGMPQSPAALADFVASRLAISVWLKQQLLEELSGKRRLEIEAESISEAISELTPQLRAVQAEKYRGFGRLN